MVLAGYATHGTLARTLESNPRQVDSLCGTRKISVRCDITRISFMAHSDSNQTYSFVDALRPSSIIHARVRSSSASVRSSNLCSSSGCSRA